jgi:hypothetical protein
VRISDVQIRKFEDILDENLNWVENKKSPLPGEI